MDFLRSVAMTSAASLENPALQTSCSIVSKHGVTVTPIKLSHRMLHEQVSCQWVLERFFQQKSQKVCKTTPFAAIVELLQSRKNPKRTLLSTGPVLQEQRGKI